MTVLHPRLPVSVLLSSMLISSASGQIPELLLSEGDRLPGVSHRDPVSRIEGVRTNARGGFVVTTRTADGLSIHDYLWGSIDGSAPTVLRMPERFGDLQQISFTYGAMINDSGQLFYGATVYDHAKGRTETTFFRDDEPIFSIGDPVPDVSNAFFRYSVRLIGITPGGDPLWVSELVRADGGLIGDALFQGMHARLITKAGDTRPDLPAAWKTLTWPYQVSASRSGRLAAEIWLNSSGGRASVMTESGGFLWNGILPLGGNPIPPSAGGRGERYRSFRGFAINDHGDFALAGETESGLDFIIQDEQVLAFEGERIDGVGLRGYQEMQLNEAGTLMTPIVTDQVQRIRHAVLVDGRVLVQQGDQFDRDGDGRIDRASRLDFAWPSIALGEPAPDGSTHGYVITDSRDVPNVLVRVRVDTPEAYLTARPRAILAGEPLRLRARGGLPRTEFFLCTVAANGTPRFEVALRGRYDSEGAWEERPLVPPGLAGIDADFLGLGRGPNGRFRATNVVRVQFE